LAQGYYFSHPQPPDVISYLLERNANKQEWRPPPKTDAKGEHLADAPAVVLTGAAGQPTPTPAAFEPDDETGADDDKPFKRAAPLPRR
jgi:hypothetical protein